MKRDHFPLLVPKSEFADPVLSFPRAVMRRCSWLGLGIAMAVSFSMVGPRIMAGQFGDAASRPPGFWGSIALIQICCGGLVYLGVMIGDEWASRGKQRVPAYTISVLGALAMASILQYVLRDVLNMRTLLSNREFLIRITQPAFLFLDVGIIAALAAFVYVNLQTARAANKRHQAAEVSRERARRSTIESRLQAMQARVEPQFLFNTLAQVSKLYETDSIIAGKMLDDLIAYLRAALPHLRESTSTLGKEIALVQSYLDIMRRRHGERPSVDIALPARLANIKMPSMLLLPLIDHALVYGLTTADREGTISINSSVDSGRLRIAVVDSGTAFAPATCAANLYPVHERLQALFGDQARLTLQNIEEPTEKHVNELGDQQGSQAILEIPYETTDCLDR